MAKIYRHKNRGWQVRYRVYFPDGGEREKYSYARTQVLAGQKLGYAEQLEARSLKNILTREDLLFFIRIKLVTSAEADRLNGDRVVEIPTLADLRMEFETASAAENRPGTHAVNRIRLGHLVDHFGPDRTVDTISETDVAEYRIRRLEGTNGKKPVSKVTVNKEIIKLAQILDLAVDRRAIETNPARAIRRYKETKTRKPRSLTRDEIKTLLGTAVLEKQILAGIAFPIITAYLYTGMRRSELLWLEKEDIDIDARRITIQRKLDFTTKTGESRVIGLSDRLLIILRPFLKQEGRFLFGGERPILTADGVTHGFKKIIRKADLPDTITLHSLRHTYITHLLEAGINPRRVQDLAGHKDFQTTWQYSHVLPLDKIVENSLNF
jgi:site-specific recombinase XerD